MEKNKIIILELVAIIVVGVLFGTGYGSPFKGDINLIDEGQFGSWAFHMAAGKYMFKDIYITYGPLFVYPPYLLFKFFGESAFVVRLYLTIGGIFGILILNLIMYKLKFNSFTRYTILISCILLPIMQLRQGLGLLTVLLLILSKEGKKYWNLFLGISITVTFLVSPEIGIFACFIAFLFYTYQFLIKKDAKEPVLRMVLTFTGILLGATIFYLWSVVEGWFLDYVKVTYDVLASFSGINLPNGQNFPYLFELFPKTITPLSFIKWLFSREVLLYWLFLFYIVGFTYLFLRLVLGTIKKEESYLFFILLFGFLLSAILLGRNGLGHFFFALSPTLVVGAYFIQGLWKKMSEPKDKLFACGLISILILFFIRILYLNSPYILQILQAEFKGFNRKQTMSYVGPLDISHAQKNHILTIQRYIARNTKNIDTVFFLNDQPMMYLLVQRRNPTRYDLPFIANTKEKRLEVLNDLSENQPLYIVEDTKTWAVDGVSNPKRLPEVYEYIQNNYKKINLGDGFVIYKINNEPML